MKSLEDLESSWLEAARRGLTPPASARGRVRSAALSAIAAGVSVPLPGPSTLERLSNGALDALDALRSDGAKARILFGLLGLTGVGAGGYALGLAAGRAENQVERSATTTPSALPANVAVPAIGVFEPPPGASEPARGPATVRSPQPPERAAAAPPAAAPVADTDEELRALHRIERVLRENNPRLALSLLSELDRSVPHGKLLEERYAARTVALCSLDDAASVANGRAAAFAARHPGSVYATRVNRACAVAEPERERIEAPLETDLHK
jgi:hypothetical protein